MGRRLTSRFLDDSMARAVKCLKDHEDELHKVSREQSVVITKLMTAGGRPCRVRNFEPGRGEVGVERAAIDKNTEYRGESGRGAGEEGTHWRNRGGNLGVVY